MRKGILSSYILAVLFFANVLAWTAVFDLNKPRFLEVIFFDVGQGNAIFIQTPQAHQILIDGGPASAILEKLAEEMPFGDRTIDLIILTHSHDDHLVGLIEVIKRYDVENILWTGIIEDSAAFREWEKLILESGAKIMTAQAGQRIKGKNFYIDVLYPFFGLEGMEFKDANLSSIMSRLVFGETAFLFTADAYKSMEKELLERGIEVNSNVLQVGHHGSKTSTSKEFVERVWPEIAVISVGRDNRYGHPHQETLDTLARYDITILRTDRDGDIKIFSDGENLKIFNLQYPISNQYQIFNIKYQNNKN